MSSTRASLWVAIGCGLGIGGLSTSVSCIIPDHGIVALVDCGARWCADAPFAQAQDEGDEVVQVQQTNPDGTVGWVTECVCMTPAEDLVLLAGEPYLQYELLRNQVLDATRQRCLDVAVANGLDPDPPLDDPEALEPDCYEAVTSVFRDGCCAVLSNQCGGVNSCDLGGTGGAETMTTGEGSDGPDSADGTTGEMSSLDELYGEIECAGTSCRIGQPLIDALLANPEAALAEGTSLALYPSHAPTGLLVSGVEPGGLAHRLGLLEGDQVVQVDMLPLTKEGEIFAAIGHAYEADEVAVTLVRGGKMLERRYLRTR